MQLIRRFSKGFWLLLCAIDIFSKYIGVIPLKDKKKGITITNVFQKSLDESNRKPKQTIGIYRQWILQQINDTWLQGKNIEMYSIHNKGKFVVAERFIWNLKNKIYKYMSSLSKNVYIDKLDEIVNKYNNIYRTIEPYIFTDLSLENNK